MKYSVSAGICAAELRPMNYFINTLLKIGKLLAKLLKKILKPLRKVALPYFKFGANLTKDYAL